MQLIRKSTKLLIKNFKAVDSERTALLKKLKKYEIKNKKSFLSEKYSHFMSNSLVFDEHSNSIEKEDNFIKKRSKGDESISRKSKPNKLLEGSINVNLNHHKGSISTNKTITLHKGHRRGNIYTEYQDYTLGKNKLRSCSLIK